METIRKHPESFQSLVESMVAKLPKDSDFFNNMKIDQFGNIYAIQKCFDDFGDDDVITRVVSDSLKEYKLNSYNRPVIYSLSGDNNILNTNTYVL